VTASSSLSGPARVGEDRAVLSCQVEANPAASIIWRRVGSLKVLGDEPELLLDPVRVEDGGNYTCHASNELGHDISRPVTINTFYPPSPDGVIIEASVAGPLLDTEDTLRLSCGAEANPAPEITWLRIPSGDTELELVSQGRDLVLSPVTKEDRGEYYCIASNDFGFVNKTYEIDVLYAPIVQVSASKTTVTEGQDSLQLTCEVDANPPATIEWIKNLNTDQEEVIGTGSTIRISTVRRGNAGTYNCVATNSVGTSIP